jgi:malonate-semialdehyde dehydrogenase (acetylating)/methylmalonate-semialdehyde dehydrogenase
VVILPDADLAGAADVIADSAFGCAGQRCLATSLAITVGDASRPFAEAMQQKARTRITGDGLDSGVQMGPVISPQSRTRIVGLIDKAVSEGARALVDGRVPDVPGRGNFVKPTVLEGLSYTSEITGTEIFGPVLSLHHAEDIDAAIALVNSGAYGNQACLFTRSGASARKFRYEAEVGNIGINIAVAAPMAFFPFSGARASFFGDLHGQGRDAIEFFTQQKVVVERWPSQWARRF